MTDKPDADLLERMAEANEQTADYILSGNVPTFMPAPPPLVAGILKATAVVQRKLAKDARDGKLVKERCSTDG
jgi:hypothetical protein